MNRQTTITTLPRFLYLNFYAFLLLFIGAGVLAVPLYAVSKWWLVPQLILLVICWKGAFGIFMSWSDKKRKYALLMQRNAAELRPDTFTEYMQAPCGRLLAKTVLKDLGLDDQYFRLQQLRKPLRKRLEEGCKPQKTVIYYHNDQL